MGPTAARAGTSPRPATLQQQTQSRTVATMGTRPAEWFATTGALLGTSRTVAMTENRLASAWVLGALLELSQTAATRRRHAIYWLDTQALWHPSTTAVILSMDATILLSEGDVGPIEKSCNGMDKSCYYLAFGGNVASIHKSCNSKTQAPCSNLARSKSGKTSIGNVRNKRGTEKIRRHSKDQAGTIVECLAKCANNKHGCTSIQWKEKIQRSCGLFKGKLTVKCGKHNVCVKV